MGLAPILAQEIFQEIVQIHNKETIAVYGSNDRLRKKYLTGMKNNIGI